MSESLRLVLAHVLVLGFLSNRAFNQVHSLSFLIRRRLDLVDGESLRLWFLLERRRPIRWLFLEELRPFFGVLILA